MSDVDLPDECCATCKFGRDHRTEIMGSCHKYAPRPIVTWHERDAEDGGMEGEISDRDYKEYPVWPATLENDWCGEWQPKRSH